MVRASPEGRHLGYVGLPERQTVAATPARRRDQGLESAPGKGSVMGSNRFSHRWLLMAVAVWAALVSPAQAESVWDALRTPGAVVVLRHSYAPGGFDPPGARLDDCSTQRNLDESGRAQARRLGEAFKKRDLSVGVVLTSPRCRCLDTARLAFGTAEAWLPLQGALRDTELRQRQII